MAKQGVQKMFLLILPLVLSPISAAEQERRIAILGDSLGTGGAAHPDLHFDSQMLYEIFSGHKTLVPRPEDVLVLRQEGVLQQDQSLATPTRLAISRHEFDGSINWVGKHTINAFSRQYLDFEEYSWGNLLGLSLKVPPPQIEIAAEDGARMKAVHRQMDRLLDQNAQLPDHVFLFFTGNDVCGPSGDFVTTAEDYGLQLQRGLRYLARNGKSAASGTRIWVMDPVGVMQLVTSDAIQNKSVKAHGRTMTCRELQKGQGPKLGESLAAGDLQQPEKVYFLQMFPRSPADYCPTVFGRGFDRDPQEVQQMIANRIRDYRREIQDGVVALQEEGKKESRFAGFSFHHVPDTGLLVFGPEDIAEDCFHLALRGQLKVAKAVLAAMEREKALF